MKSGSLTQVFLAVSLIAILAVEKSSQNVAQFGLMIRHTTGRKALDFNKYGNWCGYGGGGPIVDSIDRCCYNHDKCWADLKRGVCKKYNLLFTTYSWKKRSNRRLSCTRSWWGSSRCKRALCECDKACALCFKRENGSYNNSNKHR
ncbi:basic phospholipase A2 nigroxin B-like [Tubulanus polymorphus]|uniref:basic phospholipase A2 nigroxin B-like n=1 Tax=Tubulanus polymorphus TaxID=672921 RepID=UPI003DA68457